MTVTTNDLYWLAGLLEGEGCFTHNNSPRVALGMTDLDVVERAQRILGHGTVREENRGVDRKRIFILNICAKDAIALMLTLYPLMGSRRQERIREVVAWWRVTPGAGTGNRRRTYKKTAVA